MCVGAHRMSRCLTCAAWRVTAVGLFRCDVRGGFSERHADLAEVAAPFHECKSIGGAFEGKHLLNHRLEPVRRNGPVHRLKARARTDRYALIAHHRPDQLADAHLGPVPTYEADHAHEAAEGD